jgi:mono/diheme cytochrome c family protein
VAALVVVAACSKKDSAPSEETTAKPEAPQSAAAAAGEIFRSRCALCHGLQGKGDGPSAATLQPRPRDFGDKEWQKTVTDESLRKVIVKGGPAVGKSVTMPQSPDLENKPEVAAELVKIVRAFGK